MSVADRHKLFDRFHQTFFKEFLPKIGFKPISSYEEALCILDLDSASGVTRGEAIFILVVDEMSIK